MSTPTNRTQTPTPTLLFHSLPPTAFLGLDLLSLTLSPKLQGIKNLPPGYHFLYSSTDASLSIRRGWWFCVPAPDSANEGSKSDSQPELSVWRWSNEEESLAPDADPAAVGKAHANLGRVWERGLLDYTHPSSGKDGGELAGEWRELTNCITNALLDRVFSGGQEDETKDAKGKDWSISSISSASQDVEKIPGLTSSESKMEGEKDLGFLPIDLKRTWPEGAVGRERTDAVRDRSWYLGYLIELAAGSGKEKRVGAMRLLGELQLCFLMVLTLANWSCLEHWKRVLGVILSCRQALQEVEEYFVAVVKLLRLQLKHCEDVEGGLFDFKEEGAAWLKRLLAQFRRNVEEMLEAADGELLKAELKKLDEDLSNQYGWVSGMDMLKRGFLDLEDGERVDMDLNGADEEDETGDYAPVIVELGSHSPGIVSP
jgi:A1 cistron-splicing factor AAR2